MKRGIVRASTWLFTIVLVTAVGAGGVSAYTLFGGDLDLKGHVRNITSTRTQNPHPGLGGGQFDEWDIGLMRSFLQLEATVTLSPAFRVYARGRAEYDASFDIKGVEDFPDGVVDDQRDDIDIRELFVDLRQGPLFLRIGKQQVVWGESDGLRLADIINPLDLSWHYLLESWEDIRIGLWMVRGIYSLTPNLDVELVWNPAKFEPTKWAGAGTYWEVPGLGRGGIPERHYGTELDNGSVGAKIRAILPWGIEASVYDYYHRNEMPSLTLTPTGLFWTHPYVNSIGATFNTFLEWPKTVFRGEAVYTMNEPQLDFTSSNFISDKDSVAFMFGLDRNTYLPINPESSLISFQVFHKKVLDTDETTVSFGGPGEDFQTVVTGFLSSSYPHLIPNATLTPQVLVAYDVEGAGWVQPQISLRYGDHWGTTLGSNFFWGHDTTRGFFNPVNDRDEIFLSLKYSFQ
ncbi:MAG: DUF1302 family protein [bacterium]